MKLFSRLMSRRSLLSIALLAGMTGFVGCKPEVAQTEAPVENQIVEEMSGDAGVDGATWLVSFAQAKRISEETGRPILVDFTGSDWCGWCIRLDEEVFSKPVFQTWAKDKVVLLKLDFPQSIQLSAALEQQNQRLLKLYNVSGFPTVLFLDAKGNPIGESGYRSEDPVEWVTHASGEIGANQ